MKNSSENEEKEVAVIGYIVSLIALAVSLPSFLADVTSVSLETEILLLTTLVAGIITLVVNSFDTSLFPKQTIKVNYPQLSIVGIIRDRKGRETLKNMRILFFSLFGYILLSIIFKLQLDSYVINAGLLVALLLGVYNLVFNFRIRFRFYGNNEREAREIVQFVYKEAENIDFRNNGKRKQIFTESDLAELEDSLRSPWLPKHT